jgi:hypothetical protein
LFSSQGTGRFNRLGVVTSTKVVPHTVVDQMWQRRQHQMGSKRGDVAHPLIVLMEVRLSLLCAVQIVCDLSFSSVLGTSDRDQLEQSGDFAFGTRTDVYVVILTKLVFIQTMRKYNPADRMMSSRRVESGERAQALYVSDRYRTCAQWRRMLSAGAPC